MKKKPVKHVAVKTAKQLKHKPISCIKCDVSVDKKPLSRTTRLGSKQANWMCEDCIKKNPKLKQYQPDKETKELARIFYRP